MKWNEMAEPEVPLIKEIKNTDKESQEIPNLSRWRKFKSDPFYSQFTTVYATILFISLWIYYVMSFKAFLKFYATAFRIMTELLDLLVSQPSSFEGALQDLGNDLCLFTVMDVEMMCSGPTLFVLWPTIFPLFFSVYKRSAVCLQLCGFVMIAHIAVVTFPVMFYIFFWKFNFPLFFVFAIQPIALRNIFYTARLYKKEEEQRDPKGAKLRQRIYYAVCLA